MRVAIVGNGYVLAQSRKGREIDSHDVVIRVSPKYYDDDITGNKTDIIACIDIHYSEYINKNKKLWLFVGIPFFSEDDKLPFINKYGYNNEYIGVNRELESAIRIVSRLRPTDASAATTGMRTVFEAMNKFSNAQINVYGFDFYGQKYHHWYKPENCNPGKAHHVESERLIFNKFVKDGKFNHINDVIDYEPKLKEIDVVKETIIKPEPEEVIEPKHPDIIPRVKKPVVKKGK